MFIYFERIFSVLYFILGLILFIFKYIYLVYNGRDFAAEICGLFFMLILNFIKLRNANKANKTETITYHWYTVLFSIPVMIGYFYYLYHQVYCLSFDVALSGFGLFFSFFVLFFSIIASFMIPNDEEKKIDNEYIKN